MAVVVWRWWCGGGVVVTVLCGDSFGGVVVMVLWFCGDGGWGFVVGGLR